MSTAIEIVRRDDPQGKALLYACPKCGAINSPAIYLAREEVAHATAREAAENCYGCREHNTCTDCGEQCDKHRIKCDPCSKKTTIAKAKIIDAAELDECFGYDGTFYRDPEEARDAGEEFVFAAKFAPYRLDVESVVDGLLEEHHEDASVDDLVAVDKLIKAVERFNKAQKSGSYFEDRSRIALLSTAQIDARTQQ